MNCGPDGHPTEKKCYANINNCLAWLQYVTLCVAGEPVIACRSAASISPFSSSTSPREARMTGIVLPLLDSVSVLSSSTSKLRIVTPLSFVSPVDEQRLFAYFSILLTTGEYLVQ